MKRGRDEEVRWIGRNREWLEQNYPGKWIAVQGTDLVAVGDSLSDVSAQAAAKGFPDPVFDGVRAKPYQGVTMIRTWR